MNSAVELTIASVSFESARRLHRLHGHSFHATVFARLPNDWPSFPGAAVTDCAQRLQQCVHPLDHALINEHIADPTDGNIARWIHKHVEVPGVVRVAVRSTPMHGIDLDGPGDAYAWRRYRFQSAHHLPKVPLGHKCGRMHGHGFEAVLHTKGLSQERIDEAWAPLSIELNYRCLNDIDGLDNPTSEVLAAWIWHRLKPQLPELAGVSIYETGSCGANFDGREHRIWKDFHFDSATLLRSAPAGHPRGRFHGCTYTLRLHMKARLNPVMGWTIDFGDVKRLFEPIFRSLDHHSLLELDGLHDGDTASLAAWIFAHAQPKLPSLTRIDLYETPGCGALLAQSACGPVMPV
jgi:6-pyruvoyltetrahydropterin/6-carboxytetrahydropterin synthase